MPSLSDQLTPLQQTILDVVRKYPGQFSRSGLAKMLVGATAVTRHPPKPKHI